MVEFASGDRLKIHCRMSGKALTAQVILRTAVAPFALQCFHLVVTQALLRKLSLHFPVDLTGFACVLGVQFIGFAAALTVWRYLAHRTPAERTLSSLILLQAVVLFLVLLSGSWIAVTIALYFFLAGIQYALIFEVCRDPGHNSGSARLNVLIYAGSALGLLIAEKVLFRLLPLSFILVGAALAQTLTATVFSRRTDVAPGREGQTAGRKMPRLALFYSVVAGFLLFGGILITLRILKIYVRDTSETIAEVTVTSMLISALVSLLFLYTRVLGSAWIRAALPAFGLFVFFMAARHMDPLSAAPRAVFLVFLLVGISATSSFLFNLAFLSSPEGNSPVRSILMVNSWGAAAGGIVFGLLLLPLFTFTVVFQVYVLIFAICLLCLFLTAWREIRTRALRIVSAAVFGLTAVTVFSLGWNSGWYREQLAMHAARIAPGETIEGFAETPQGIWMLTARRLANRPIFHRLVNNAHSMTGTMFLARRYMKLMSYLAWLYAEKPASALNIGYGTGLTAQALLEFKDLKQLDVVDITDAILPLTTSIHQNEKRIDPLTDNRLSFRTGGARYVLEQTNKQYDIITGEPPPPANSGVAYLYTREFFNLAKSRLTPHGVLTYWLPTHELSMEMNLRLIATFCSVFSECDLFAGTEVNLILVGYGSGRRQNLKAKFADLGTTRFSRDTALETPEQLFSLLVATKTGLSADYRGLPLVSDDFAYIESYIPEKGLALPAVFQPHLTRQEANVSALAARLFGDQQLDLEKLDSRLIFTIETALDLEAALKALAHAWRSHAPTLTFGWLLGFDENVEAAIAGAGFPESHPLAIRSKVIQMLRRRDLSRAIQAIHRWPDLLARDRHLSLLLTTLESLEKR